MSIPHEATNALSIVQERFADSLVAVYLHGSAVAGGLRPRSDVDVLVVIDQSMTVDGRTALAADLMRISGRYPTDPEGRHPLELIVFSRSDLEDARYPARCEFIYGEWLRHEYAAGKTPRPVRDPELTLVLAQSRQEAIPLLGPSADILLPSIPPSDIRRAIVDALPALIGSLQGDERNVVLTLVRMWKTVVTGEFVSKDRAADWAIDRLPAIQADVVAYAREIYVSGDAEDWHDRQHELERTVRSLHKLLLANLHGSGERSFTDGQASQ